MRWPAPAPRGNMGPQRRCLSPGSWPGCPARSCGLRIAFTYSPLASPSPACIPTGSFTPKPADPRPSFRPWKTVCANPGLPAWWVSLPAASL